MDYPIHGLGREWDGRDKDFDEQKGGVKMCFAICVGFRCFGFALNCLKLVLRLFENKSKSFCMK